MQQPPQSSQPNAPQPPQTQSGQAQGYAPQPPAAPGYPTQPVYQQPAPGAPIPQSSPGYAQQPPVQQGYAPPAPQAAPVQGGQVPGVPPYAAPQQAGAPYSYSTAPPPVAPCYNAPPPMPGQPYYPAAPVARQASLRPFLLIATVAALVACAGFVFAARVFLPRFNLPFLFAPLPLGLWLSAFGILLWSAAALLVGLRSSSKITKACGIVAAVPGILAAIGMLYYAIDFRNLFLLMRYGLEISTLLALYLPGILMAGLLLGMAVYSIGVAAAIKKPAALITGVLAALAALTTALLYLLMNNVLRPLVPAWVFLVVWIITCVLLCVHNIVAAVMASK